jgi:thymidine kinase
MPYLIADQLRSEALTHVVAICFCGRDAYVILRQQHAGMGARPGPASA